VAAGEGWPPSSGATADQFVARANTEALLPLLFADDGLPPVVADALGRVRALERLSARRSDILLAAERHVSEVLRHEPFIVLKGADYRHRLYPTPRLRPMQDIDILVPRSRMEAVSRALVTGGLSRVPLSVVWQSPYPLSATGDLSSHHEQLFRLGDVSVDVHHSFVQRSRNRVDYDGVWARKVPVDTFGASAYRLADSDALVYHAISMASEEFSVPLLRYVDLWMMIRVAPGICPAAVQRAREWRVQRALYGAYRLAVRLIPELECLGPGSATPGLLRPSVRRFLDLKVLPDPWEHGDGREPGRAVQIWRKLCLIDALRYRATFGLYHAYALVRGYLAAAQRRPPPPGETAKAPTSV